MTSSALIVPLYFQYCTIAVHILCNTTLLATETAVCAAFVITEPHLTFNWPLKHTSEMALHREGIEVSIDPISRRPKFYGAVHLHTAKSKQWLCSTATAPNRKSENTSLSGGGDFTFSTRVYYSL